MKRYTIALSVEEAKELGFEGQVISCNDCGAYAESEKKVVHHKTCKDGESEKWEKFYEKANKVKEAK